MPGIGTSLSDAFAVSKDEISALLVEHGALLFRGFVNGDLLEFDACVDALATDRLPYGNRSTPRTEVGNRIYTATEYPAAREILLHNENSYQRDWPMKVIFCCLQPAAEGGETPIADMRRVTKEIGKATTEEFEASGVKYVRNYYENVDLSWQTAFQTDNRAVLEEYCAANKIHFEWSEEGLLRTSQVCQGTAIHPDTGERFFFNQAHLFHVSSLGAAAAAVINVFGRSKLPRQCYFGTGADIPESTLEHVRASFRRSAVTFIWQKGDVLLLDNMRVAHGRRPFKGQRRVVTVLAEPYSIRAAPHAPPQPGS